MSSGVAVDPKCIEEFNNNLKLGKKLKYITYKLSADNTQIEVDKNSEVAGAEYQDFVKALPQNECRYAVYDFSYDQGEGQRSKLFFVSWSPDEAKIKNKMLYASSKDALRKALVGIPAEIQATDLSEISMEAFLDKVTRR